VPKVRLVKKPRESFTTIGSCRSLHVVVGAGHGFVVGLLAADDLHQRHLVDRAEEVDADELVGLGAGLARPVIGRVEVLLAKKPPSARAWARPPWSPGLELAVLEHRLDDQVAAGRSAALAVGVMRASRLGLLLRLMRPLSTRFRVSFAE
jgi:hypothetical protein